MSTVYHCCKRLKDVNGTLDVVHYANSEKEAVEWLENNGGGVYKNTLHNFEMNVAPLLPVRKGYLKKDMQERYNSKRAWFVNAWRIVDANGKDMVQPWSVTKGDAIKIAKALNIQLCNLHEFRRKKKPWSLKPFKPKNIDYSSIGKPRLSGYDNPEPYCPEEE
jgi:hypothetical protein